MYAYVSTLTIDHTKVVGASHSDFPVLVDITSADLRTVANGGRVQNGNDINFYPYGSYTTALKWELESYSATTGRVLAHVRLPSITSSAPTPFDIAYGDASITTFQGDVAGTWSNGYSGVWHFGTPSSLVIASSIGSMSGTNTGGVAAATGKIGGAANFAGSNRYLGYGNVLNVGSSSFTASCWINYPTQALQNFCGVYYKGDEPNTPSDFYGLVVHTDNRPFCGVNSGSGTDNRIGVSAPSLSNWHKIDQRLDRSANTHSLWIDGTQVSSASAASIGDITSSSGLFFGSRTAFGGQGNFYTGLLDEMRIAVAVARSDGWLQTEYANQNSPSTFLSLGASHPLAGRRYWIMSGGDLGAGRILTGGRL